MPQTVHPFICGRFIVYFSVKWIDFSKRHKPSNLSFVDALSLFSSKRHDFSKCCNPSNPSFMSAPSSFCKMPRTVHPFIYGRFMGNVQKIKVFWSLLWDWIFVIIWNHLKWLLFNYIEKWNLYENLKAVLPWERKFSALEKKWNLNKNIFSKIERPGFGGCGQFAAFYKNDVNFENIVYYSEKNEFFRISYFKNIR